MKTAPDHELFMRRCIELAELGMGRVAPNPMVGSVIVYKNTVIGEGYHQNYGKAHAEVNAIASVSNPALLAQSTLYVNLEPCAHLGKTPPCCDLILEKKIQQVVIGTADPNVLVSGKGIDRLRNGGVDLVTNVLTRECEHLNRRFFTYHRLHRPYILLKWAQTADGFIDKLRIPGETAKINWISNPLSKILVHKWRAEEQAILVGTHTVLNDNPELNVRHWEGLSPLRVIIDRNLKIPALSHVMDNSQNTLVINEIKSVLNGKTEFIKINFNENILEQILLELYNRKILSLMVEGGAKTLESFIKPGYWDEARVITGTRKFGEGLPSPVIPGSVHEFKLLNDTISSHYNILPPTHFKSINHTNIKNNT